MKRGITVRGDYDFHDRSVTIVEKSRGKLTIDEIEDALRTNDRGLYCGNYVLLLRCGEATLGGSGWDDYEEPKGDSVALYAVGEADECPVCSRLVPPYQYCPECGSNWDSEGDAAVRAATVENLLDAMREEVEHRTRSGDLSAYWQYTGAVSMAKQVGFIDTKKAAELIEKAATFKQEGVK